MNIISFFNPYNLEHIKAYEHLCNTGCWPQAFFEEIRELEFSVGWQMLLASKLSNAWVRYILSR